MQTDVVQILLFTAGAAALFYILPVKYRVVWLGLMSSLFYLICDKGMFWLLICDALCSWLIAKAVEKKSGKGKKIWLGIGMGICLCLFGVFKWNNFFAGELERLFMAVSGRQVRLPVLLMPLGISYYSLKILSYLLDVYWGKRKAEKSFLFYYLYVAFFPHIICGPIERSEGMTDQFRDGLVFQKELFQSGLFMILGGAFKKLVIANRLAGYVETVFAAPDSYPGLALWMAAVFYTIQLYCDFSGYSDIAIGISAMYGIKCRKNFDCPLFSASIKEFWRRWHISLSSWLRDYVYIPLGGNRRGALKKAGNTMVTFLISGLWHGGSFNYLIWGAWHGLLNLMPPKKGQKEGKKKGRLLLGGQILGTFFCVVFGFILFHETSVKAGFHFIFRMFQNLSFSADAVVMSVLPFTMDYTCVAYFLTALLFILILAVREFRQVFVHHGAAQENLAWGLFFGISVFLFGIFGANSFLYAQF